MAYLPKLKPAVGNQLGGMPERREAATVSSISSAFNWINPVSYSGNNKSVTTEDAFPYAVNLSSDETKMYVLGRTGNNVYQYSLPDINDISTASYDSKSISVITPATAPSGMVFSTDGGTMFISDLGTDFIYQYTLSTPWDISSASYASKSKDVSTEDLSPNGITVSSDGLTLFMAGNNSSFIYQYTLSTPWDISTASYASKSKDVSGEASSPTGVATSPDGRKMYVTSASAGGTAQYTLSTPFDVSTASYDNFKAGITTEDASMSGVAFASNGEVMYGIGGTNDRVYQYNIVNYT